MSSVNTGTRRKKNEKWTVEDEIVVIEFYEQNRILWDSKNIASERAKKSSLLSILIDSLYNKYTEVEIKLRFSIMRSTFQSNLKRKLKATQNGTKAKIIWPHFSRMMFLSINPVIDQNRDDENIHDEIVPSSLVPVSIKWTIQEEELLIDFYQIHEELWNHRLPNYKLASKSQLSDEVVFALEQKFNRQQINEKFSSLKTKFFNEYKKVDQSAKSGAGTDDVYESTFVHFERLQFLRTCIEVDPSVSFLDIQLEEEFNYNEYDEYLDEEEEEEGYYGDENTNTASSTPTNYSNSFTQIKTTYTESDQKAPRTPFKPKNVQAPKKVLFTPTTSSQSSQKSTFISLPSTSSSQQSPFIPLPPKRPRKKTTDKTSDASDALMEKAILLLEKVTNRNDINPDDEIDECRSAGNFVTFVLSTMPKKARTELIAKTMELYKQT